MADAPAHWKAGDVYRAPVSLTSHRATWLLRRIGAPMVSYWMADYVCELVQHRTIQLDCPSDPIRAETDVRTFQVWPPRQSLDAVIDLIRLAAMFAARGDDKPLYVFRHARRRAACCEQTLFNVGARPIAKT